VVHDIVVQATAASNDSASITVTLQLLLEVTVRMLTQSSCYSAYPLRSCSVLDD
jgi:hypothetical protein